MDTERRKKGLGRLSDEQRQLKNSGKSYATRKGSVVPEKKKPNLEVSFSIDSIDLFALI